LRNQDDQDLRRHFEALQEHDLPQVPAFETLMDRAREQAAREGLQVRPPARLPSPVFRRVAWSGGLFAAAVAILLLARFPGTSDSDFVQVVEAFTADPAAGAWKSPTDGLLDLPGHEILSTVPGIETRRWMVAPRPGPGRNDT